MTITIELHVVGTLGCQYKIITWVLRPTLRPSNYEFFSSFFKRSGPWTPSVSWLSGGQGEFMKPFMSSMGLGGDWVSSKLKREGNIKMFPISISSQEIRLLLQEDHCQAQSHQLALQMTPKLFQDFFHWPIHISLKPEAVLSENSRLTLSCLNCSRKRVVP